MAKRDLYTAPRQMADGRMTSNNSGNNAQEIDLTSGQERLDSIVSKYESKKKTYNGILLGILGLIGLYFAYKYVIAGPKETKASEALASCNAYMLMDSINLMVNGSTSEKGAKKIADEFSGTKAGNLAAYMAGVGSLKLGNFKDAIKYLEKFDGKGTLLSNTAKGSLGDAYWENNQLDKAVAAYEVAGSDENDFQFSPHYLLRASMIYEQQGKIEKAIELLKKIKSTYPQSAVARDLDRHLARLGVTTE
jgi:tetratricopeptide (TPR) repeat protein